MGIEHSHLIELYKNDLVLKVEAGEIIPEGIISTPDGKFEGVRLMFNNQPFIVNLSALSGTTNNLYALLLKDGVSLKRGETKGFVDYIAKCISPASKALLSNYIVPTRNGFLDAELVYVQGYRVYRNKDQKKQDEVLPSELRDPMRERFEKKGCKEAYYNVILNKLTPDFIVLVVLVALSGCLLKFVNIDGGGFHIFGPSGVGKTILLKIAASVMGSSSSPDQGSQEPCYMMSWGATKNGIEAKFNLFNDGLLILDELGKYTSKNFGADVYAIAGGAYTMRMNSSLESVDLKPANFMLLSSGELSMQEMLRRLKEPLLGQGKSVRMPGIPLESSDLNCPELYSDSEAASKAFEDAINDNCGFLFEDFIKKLLNHKQSYDELRVDVKARFESVLAEMNKRLPNKGSIESRVLKRFALMAVAGQLAYEFGVLPWNDEKVMEALSFVYKRYHSYEPNRLSDAEIAFRQIKRKLQSEQGNFVRVKSTTVPNKHYGYISDTHYYIYTEVFKGWLMSANESDVIQLLINNKLLKSEAGRNTLRTTEHLSKRGNVRGASCHNQRRETFYCIDRDIVSLELD